MHHSQLINLNTFMKEKLRGTVRRGSRNGTTRFGVPTANIKWKPLPSNVKMELYHGKTAIDGKIYDVAVLHVGNSLAECHIIDFEGDLYDKELEVDIIKKIPTPVPFSKRPVGSKNWIQAKVDLVKLELLSD